MKETFTPATEEEIATYRDEKYLKWLEDCENALRNLHDTLEDRDGKPVFCFAAMNQGKRSGNDVLITVEAKGDFAIMPPEPVDESKETEADPKLFQLPQPPAPPRGTWKLKPYTGTFDTIRSIERAMGVYARPLMPDFGSQIAALDIGRERDPNAFYWKPRRPVTPESEFSLECKRWRHGLGAELFVGEIHFDRDRDELAGALECRIHAGNLSDIAVMLLRVRMRIMSVSALETAEELVEKLVNPVSGLL